MRGTLGGLYCRCNLRVRRRKKAHHLLGEPLVRCQAGELALPEIEITAGEPVELAVVAAGALVRLVCHRLTITHRRVPDFAGANAALSHCGIGAKVGRPNERAFIACPTPQERSA